MLSLLVEMRSKWSRTYSCCCCQSNPANIHNLRGHNWLHVLISRPFFFSFLLLPHFLLSSYTCGSEWPSHIAQRLIGFFSLFPTILSL
jgi:hypothetical protein